MKMGYLLGGAVAAAAVFGYVDLARRPAASASASETRGVETGVGSTGDTPENGAALSGRVLETLDVAKYTYLRLATGQGEVWAAVPKAPIQTGATVTVEHAARMDHFASATLKRTFDVIYFGSLAGAPSVGTDLPPGHPPIGSNANRPSNGHVDLGKDPGIPEALLDNPGGALPPGHPSVGSGATTADGEPALPPGHPDSLSSSAPLAVPKLAKAPGPNGYRVGDVYANSQRLAGQRVRVRGMVTKVTLDVLGGTFLHLRDGSGDGAKKTDDLAVTTPEKPARGDVVVLEGVLRLDADLGIGYRYPALLENAIPVKE
jgi:hypothetical protein